MVKVSCSCGEKFEAAPDPGSGVVICPGCGSSLRVGSGSGLQIKKKHVLYGVLAFLGFLILAALFILSPPVFLLLLMLAGGTGVELLKNRAPNKPVACPRCGGQNIQLVGETHTKGRGCLSALLNLFVMFFIWWIWLFVWLARGKKTINKTKAVCLSCQNQWYI